MKNIIGLSKLVSHPRENRPALEQIQVKNGTITATNGYIMGSCENNNQVEGEGYVPGSAINAQTKNIVINGKVELTKKNGVVYQVEQLTDNYPLVDKIWKTADELETHHTVSLGLHTLEPLVKMLKASGNQSVVLKFPKDNLKPIRAYSGNIQLVVMPVRCKNTR